MTKYADRFSTRIWVLTDGKVGMVAQALGLAERVAKHPDEIQMKTVRPAVPWRYLPAAIQPPGILRFGQSGDVERLAPPWPDLVVSCGRQAIGTTLAIGRASRGRTLLVHIQHPHVPPRRFDLVVAPAHDRLTGPNVLVTRGSVHRVTREKLDEAAARFRDSLAWLPRPLVAVLIGGSNGVYTLNRRTVTDLAGQLAALARDAGVGLAVTPSRRTGAGNEAILREALAGLPAALWDGSGENPYFGYLGLADRIVVTGDSVNMVSEACATGKPVHIVHLEGGGGKFDRFHRNLESAGITRPFRGVLEDWSYPPLDDTDLAAEAIRKRLRARREA